MMRNQPHLLSVDTTFGTPVQMRSAPSSRLASPNLGSRESGREKRGVSEVSGTLCPSRAISLPNCFKSQCSTPADDGTAVDKPPQPRGWAASPQWGSKDCKLTGKPVCAGGRSASPPGACPPVSPPSSSSSSSPPSLSPSSSAPRPPRPKLSPSLRHHTSFDSAALARDFFGQNGSVSDPLPRPGGGLDALLQENAPRKVQRQQTVTTSPLLRRQSAVDGGGPTQPGVTLSPSLRRLHVNLSGTPTASPNPARRFRRQQEVQTPSLESCGSVGDVPSPFSYFRVVVLGDDGVGKSTLVRQMTSGAGASFLRAGEFFCFVFVFAFLLVLFCFYVCFKIFIIIIFLIIIILLFLNPLQEIRIALQQDINQPSLPIPFYFVLVSLFVFKDLSTVFHSMNFPDNSPVSHSVLLVWSYLCLIDPFNYISLYESLLQP